MSSASHNHGGLSRCAVASSDRTHAAAEIEYSLAKRVPDMERGFTIATNYGDLRFEAGPGAERVRAAVEKALQAELKALS